MNNLVLAAAFLILVPTLCAQQAELNTETSQTAPQSEPQSLPQNSNTQSDLPASLRPGHSLDQADLDILTGKRDREMEASREVGVQTAIGIYGNYAHFSGGNGHFGNGFDVGLLPLTQIGNPFYFSRWRPRGFGRGGLGIGGFRGNR